jgi:hypothetical protein
VAPVSRYWLMASSMHGSPAARKDVWPSPSRVSSDDAGTALASAWDHAYGVAGSPVPPTTRIGGRLREILGLLGVWVRVGQ